jgi:anti-anti-sigma factor
MDMQFALAENIAHVKLRGRLDTHGVDEIETKLTASVVPGGHNTIVDLSDVSFVTSMGLRMFLAISKALKRHNAKMVLFAPQSQVNEVFNTVVLREIVPIVVDEAEAVRFAAT